MLDIRHIALAPEKYEHEIRSYLYEEYCSRIKSDHLTCQDIAPVKWTTPNII